MQRFECHSIPLKKQDRPSDRQTVIDFFERSQAPVPDVVFNLYAWSGLSLLSPDVWHPRFAALTHLRLFIDYTVNSSTMTNLLDELAYGSNHDSTIVFPNLQILELHTIYLDLPMTPPRWSRFVDIFPSTNPSTCKLQRSPSKVCVRLINKDRLVLGCGRDTMERHHYLRLLDVQRSGVRLELMGRDGKDLLLSAGEMYSTEVQAGSRGAELVLAADSGSERP